MGNTTSPSISLCLPLSTTLSLSLPVWSINMRFSQLWFEWMDCFQWCVVDSRWLPAPLRDQHAAEPTARRHEEDHTDVSDMFNECSPRCFWTFLPFLQLTVCLYSTTSKINHFPNMLWWTSSLTYIRIMCIDCRVYIYNIYISWYRSTLQSAQRVRMNGKYLPSAAFYTRRHHYVAEETGALRQVLSFLWVTSLLRKLIRAYLYYKYRNDVVYSA